MPTIQIALLPSRKSFLRKNKVKGNGNRHPMQSAFTSMLFKQILLADRRVFFLFLLLITLKMPIPENLSHTSTTNKSLLDTAPTVLATSRITLKRKPETTEEPTPRTVPKVNVKPATGASWVVPITRLDEEIQIRHYSPKILKTYRHWLKRFQAFTRSKTTGSLSREEIDEIVSHLSPPVDLVVKLLFGCGLRLSECFLSEGDLRIKNPEGFSLL